MNKKIKVCWISAGVSSFIAGYLERDTIDKFIYIDIDDQHPDSMRFIKDCEKVLGKEIEILKSSEYNTVEECVRTAGILKMPYGFAPCTNWLKKRVRKQWEEAHKDYEITYVWGMDCNEKRRAENIVDTMIEFDHCFPLIERNLTKADAHGISYSLGIKRPYMYDLGYNNNNCIGYKTINDMASSVGKINEKLTQIKAEAYKEAFEKVKERLFTYATDTQQMVFELRLDNLLKELVGDNE